MESDVIVVLTTAGSDEQAEQIATTLVEEGLAACVNIVPGVRSVYRWKGEIEKDHESLLLVKTTAARFADARRRIREVHSYELPELLALRVASGDPEVLAWIAATVTPPEP
jgi:periplasmic divalent cation tolerance protein